MIVSFGIKEGECEGVGIYELPLVSGDGDDDSTEIMVRMIYDDVEGGEREGRWMGVNEGVWVLINATPLTSNGIIIIIHRNHRIQGS